MFGWLLTPSQTFFDYFEKHAAAIVAASQELINLVTHEGAEAYAKRIVELEHQADDITHHCVEALHKTFITPFERDDIFRLISKMDDIVDYIEEAAGRIETYKLTSMPSEVKQMAFILFKSTLELSQSIKGLRTLRNTDLMRNSFIAINRLENEGDKTLREAIGRLFEKETDFRNLIKWKEVFESLENAIDRCEDVSNIIEGVILEND